MPAVALVSAARAMPPYIHSLVKHQYMGLLSTYIEDTSTDGRSCFCEFEFLVCWEVCLNSFVSEAVIVVKSSEREIVHVVEFHD